MNYKQNKYTDFTHLPLKLVYLAIKEGWLNTLAYFCWLRTAHKKPIFYNYTLRSVSSQINCSPATFSFHLKILLNKGLAFENNGHLILKGSTALLKEYKSILVPVMVCRGNKSNQIAALRYVIVKKNLHYQDKAITTKKDIIKLHTSKFTKYEDAKRLLKAQKKLGFNVETSTVEERLILSNVKLGAICYRSQRTGIKIQNKFNELGFVDTKRNTQIIERGHNRRSFFSKCLPSKYQLSPQGNIFISLPNVWSINPCTM